MSIWDTQRDFLQQAVVGNRQAAKRKAQKTLGVIDRNSAASQEDALRNGEPQHMLIVRMRTDRIQVTCFVGDELFGGDYIDCFGEKWLVLEAFTNENGIRYGTAHACNIKLRFQNGTHTIIERHGVHRHVSVIREDERLPIEQGFYRIHFPLDADTEKIYVGKRFAMGTGFNEHLEKVLTVIRVIWIDPKSYSIGEGNNLLTLRMQREVFNPKTDNVDEMVCDYIPVLGGRHESAAEAPEEVPALRCEIVGRPTIRFGNTRTYEVRVVNEAGEAVETNQNFVWSHNQLDGVVFTPNSRQLGIHVPMDMKLVGKQIELSVTNQRELSATLNVEVVS